MRLLVTTICVLGLIGCGDALPCRSCPPVDGVYDVSWADAGTTEDGGTCGVRPPRVATWTLAQRETNVSTTIDGVTLAGTLYDTYALTLSGTSAAVSYRLRATVIPTGTSADGGIRLQGTFTTTSTPEQGGLCEVSDAFTAQRVSR